MRNVPEAKPPPENLVPTGPVVAPVCAVFRRYLRSRKLKYTPERAVILDAIIDRDDIFEVEELLIELQENGQRISKATIYRTINLLVDSGIISQTIFDSKQSHYRLSYGREPSDVMLCMNTGKVIEFGNEALLKLREEICRKHGWKAIGHRFQIYGISPGSTPPEDGA